MKSTTTLGKKQNSDELDFFTFLRSHEGDSRRIWNIKKNNVIYVYAQGETIFRGMLFNSIYLNIIMYIFKIYKNKCIHIHANFGSFRFERL